MASIRIRRRPTAGGEPRYRVLYRLGGAESRERYGGSFRTMREARLRRDLIAGELAAGRVPELRLAEPPAPLTVEAACRAWAASRIDVAAGTRSQHASR